MALLLAVVTTTSRCNVVALLARHLGEAWAAQFTAVICAEDAPRKKPDPQAYELALQRLGLPAHATVAIEDSAAGVAAAQRAQVPVVLTRSHYFPATAATGVLACRPSLGEVGLVPAGRTAGHAREPGPDHTLAPRGGRGARAPSLESPVRVGKRARAPPARSVARHALNTPAPGVLYCVAPGEAQCGEADAARDNTHLGRTAPWRCC